MSLKLIDSLSDTMEANVSRRNIQQGIWGHVVAVLPPKVTGVNRQADEAAAAACTHHP